jgi:hypothetical protein
MCVFPMQSDLANNSAPAASFSAFDGGPQQLSAARGGREELDGILSAQSMLAKVVRAVQLVTHEVRRRRGALAEVGACVRL